MRAKTFVICILLLLISFSLQEESVEQVKQISLVNLSEDQLPSDDNKENHSICTGVGCSTKGVKKPIAPKNDTRIAGESGDAEVQASLKTKSIKPAREHNSSICRAPNCINNRGPKPAGRNSTKPEGEGGAETLFSRLGGSRKGSLTNRKEGFKSIANRKSASPSGEGGAETQARNIKFSDRNNKLPPKKDDNNICTTADCTGNPRKNNTSSSGRPSGENDDPLEEAEVLDRSSYERPDREPRIRLPDPISGICTNPALCPNRPRPTINPINGPSGENGVLSRAESLHHALARLESLLEDAQESEETLSVVHDVLSRAYDV